MNLTDFNRQIKSVIDWNAVARNMTHSFDEVTLAKQGDYIHEEIMETITAVATKNTKELLDGVGDIFVTLAYKYFLLRKEFNHDFEPVDVFEEETIVYPRQRQQSLLWITTIISGHNIYHSECVSDVEDAMSALWTLMEKVEEWYDVDMHAVVEEIMRSNWSKFPIFEEGFDYEGECRWIEAERDQNDVAFRAVEVDGIKRVSFRNGGGEGKIMKPSCFVEPDVLSLLKVA